MDILAETPLLAESMTIAERRQATKDGELQDSPFFRRSKAGESTLEELIQQWMDVDRVCITHHTRERATSN